ncbi:S1 RNA-binding domain-containing protein [Bacillus toyonensis]
MDVSKLSQETEIGEPTLVDIIDALISPERDMRDELPKPLLKKGILKLEDLQRGMELEGTVRNVVDFGAFVDIGVKQDGLVHISKLSKQFVKHPLDVVSVGQIVKVWVDDIDTKKVVLHYLCYRLNSKKREQIKLLFFYGVESVMDYEL